MNTFFEIKKTKNDEFMFNLKATNGEIILTSELYKTKSSALDGIRSVIENAALDKRYEKRKTKKDKPYFVLKAGNGEIIGKSEEYSSKAAMEKGIKAVKKNAASASTENNLNKITTINQKIMGNSNSKTPSASMDVTGIIQPIVEKTTDKLLNYLEVALKDKGHTIIGVFQNQHPTMSFTLEAVLPWAGSAPSHIKFLDSNGQPNMKPYKQVIVKPGEKLEFVIEDGSGGGIALMGKSKTDQGSTEIAILYLLADYCYITYETLGIWMKMEVYSEKDAPDDATIKVNLNDYVNNKDLQNGGTKSKLFGLQLQYFTPVMVEDAVQSVLQAQIVKGSAGQTPDENEAIAQWTVTNVEQYNNSRKG